MYNIAAICSKKGNVMAIMPHPERAIHFTHLPHWTFLREKYQRQGREIPEEADGLKIFKNGVDYFK